MIKKTLTLITGLLFFGLSSLTNAQSDAELRGGWTADIDGITHVYIIKIEDGKVTGGIYCFDCLNFDNVAFIRQGTIDEGMIDFEVLHDRGMNAPYVRKVHAEYSNGKMLISSNGGPTANPSAIEYGRQPRITFGPRLNFPPFNPKGPAELLSLDKITGRWVAYSGMLDRKQYMMLREVDGEIKGLVCGPCVDPHRMGPIENGRIDGDDLYLEIIHEDVGTPEGLNNAPNYNMVHMKIVDNEMHMESRTNTDPDNTLFTMMFVGPFKE
jgi:hypothetical protein